MTVRRLALACFTLCLTACALENEPLQPLADPGFVTLEAGLATPKPLYWSQQVTAATSANAPYADYMFSAAAGKTFQVTASLKLGTVVVTLYRQNGSTWNWLKKSAPGKSASISLTPTKAATYRVRMTPAQPGLSAQVMLICKSGFGVCKLGNSNCQAAFSAKIAPAIKDLLFMSESEFAFDVVGWPAAAKGAVTPAEMRAHLGLPESTPVEVWTPAQFFKPWLLEGDTGSQYKLMQQILTSSLQDLVILRVGTIQVQVYLIGRTSCGGVAGLHTVAIET